METLPAMDCLMNFTAQNLQPAAPSAVHIRTSKRFEFSAARALPNGRLSGNNFSGWASVRGPVDPHTGMQINIADLKGVIHTALEGFDHHNLTLQLAPLPATTANIARALFTALQPLLGGPVALETVMLQEEDENAALAGVDHTTPIVRAAFSAAHRTYAPQLSREQNQAIYGICSLPNGHGHNYVVEAGMADPDRFPLDLIRDLDHRNLSQDVPALAGRNASTEALAQLVASHTPGALWVRVWETPDFFAEYLPPTGLFRLGRQYRFHAAHRLNSPMLTRDQNRRLYGKCNRPDPHGHTYRVQVSVKSRLNLLTGTAFDLADLDRAAAAVLESLDHTYLDEEVPWFEYAPSTGENIAAFLFEAFEHNLGDALHQVTLWETPNNQFTANKK